MAARLKPLWTCPECGAQFVTRNMWHSCGKYSLKELFSRSDPHVIELFDRYAELIGRCGPVTMIPQKTRVVFMDRVRFAGALPRKSHFIATFGFLRKVDSSRFSKIENYGNDWWGHYCPVMSEKDFDKEFIGWIKEAYEVGKQSHLKRSHLLKKAAR